MRIDVLYNDDGALAHGSPRDSVAVGAVMGAASAVAAACRANGHDARFVGVPAGLAALAGVLADLRADLVFNLVESLGGEARFEAAVAWVFELAGLAYTGSPPTTLSLALDKSLAKALLRANGVPVPADRLLVRGHESLSGLAYPVIVKPTREDASHGIDLGSVVHDEASARQRARRLIEQYRQPAMVEHFVEGRELNVAIVGEGDGAECLSLGEIDFAAFPPGAPHVVTYAAKWEPDSEEYRGSVSAGARPLDDATAQAIRTTALTAYRALGVRDYGRVDIRLDAAHNPWVLEVNPNPDISPDAGLARAAQRSGIAYDRLIERIVRSAATR